MLLEKFALTTPTSYGTDVQTRSDVQLPQVDAASRIVAMCRQVEAPAGSVKLPVLTGRPTSAMVAERATRLTGDPAFDATPAEAALHTGMVVR